MDVNDISERDYDLLVDTEILADVIFGHTYITIKEFLNISEGEILSLNKSAGEGGDIYINSRIIGTGDIIVIDEKIAVRIQDAMDPDSVVSYFFEEQMN